MLSGEIATDPERAAFLAQGNRVGERFATSQNSIDVEALLQLDRSN